MKTITLTQIGLFSNKKVSVNPNDISSIEVIDGDTWVTMGSGKEYIVTEKEEEIRKMAAEVAATPQLPGPIPAPQPEPPK